MAGLGFAAGATGVRGCRARAWAGQLRLACGLAAGGGRDRSGCYRVHSGCSSASRQLQKENRNSGSWRPAWQGCSRSGKLEAGPSRSVQHRKLVGQCWRDGSERQQPWALT